MSRPDREGGWSAERSINPPAALSGAEIQAEAFRMFESWRNIYHPDYDGDILELITLYTAAPNEQLAAAARAARIKPPQQS